MATHINQAIVGISLALTTRKTTDGFIRKQSQRRVGVGGKSDQRSVTDGVAPGNLKNPVLNLRATGVDVVPAEQKGAGSGLGQSRVRAEVSPQLEDGGAILGNDEFRDVGSLGTRKDRAVHETGCAGDVVGHEKSAAGDAQNAARC